MWFAWGYRWDVTPRDLAGGRAPFGAVGGWSGRYVRLTGCRPVAGAPPGDSRLGAVRAFEGEDGSVVFVTGPASDPDRPAGRAAPAEVQDRLVFVVRADAGRWTTRSVLAVLVGLWGAAITVSVSAAWLHLRREGGPAKSGRD